MIDQAKIQDALADFHGLIAVGKDADTAIQIAARENEVPEQTLKDRLEHYGGDLPSLERKSRRISENDTVKSLISFLPREARFLHEVPGFGGGLVREVNVEAVREEIKTRIGRELNEDELLKLQNIAWSRWKKLNFFRYLRKKK